MSAEHVRLCVRSEPSFHPNGCSAWQIVAPAKISTVDEAGPTASQRPMLALIGHSDRSALGRVRNRIGRFRYSFNYQKDQFQVLLLEFCQLRLLLLNSKQAKRLIRTAYYVQRYRCCILRAYRMLASLASIRRHFVIEVPLYARAAITPKGHITCDPHPRRSGDTRGDSGVGTCRSGGSARTASVGSFSRRRKRDRRSGGRRPIARCLPRGHGIVGPGRHRVADGRRHVHARAAAPPVHG